MIRSIAEEIPALMKVYTVLSALILHTGVIGYIAYLNYTCTGWCLGVAAYTELVKLSILVLLVLSAVIVLVIALIRAYYIRNLEVGGDDL